MDPQNTTAPVASPAPQGSKQLVPDNWPESSLKLLAYSREVVRLNLWTLVGLFVANVALGIVLQTVLKQAGQLIAELLSIAFGIATTGVFLAGVRGEQVSFGDSFKIISFDMYLKYLGLAVLTGLIALVSFLLLIVPFFIVVPRLSLATYFLVDKKLGPSEALKASWAATKGNLGKVWGIILVTVLFAILCLVLVGIYFLIMYSAAFAVLYAYLQRNQPQTPATPTAPAAPSSETPTAQ